MPITWQSFNKEGQQTNMFFMFTKFTPRVGIDLAISPEVLMSLILKKNGYYIIEFIT